MGFFSALEDDNPVRPPTPIQLVFVAAVSITGAVSMYASAWKVFTFRPANLSLMVWMIMGGIGLAVGALNFWVARGTLIPDPSSYRSFRKAFRFTAELALGVGVAWGFFWTVPTILPVIPILVAAIAVLSIPKLE